MLLVHCSVGFATPLIRIESETKMGEFDTDVKAVNKPFDIAFDRDLTPVKVSGRFDSSAMYLCHTFGKLQRCTIFYKRKPAFAAIYGLGRWSLPPIYPKSKLWGKAAFRDGNDEKIV